MTIQQAGLSPHSVRDRSSWGLGRSRGFTLIELAIVVLVISILATIAFPAYNDSLRKGRRGQAKSDVVQVAQMMERCYTASNTYVSCAGGDDTLDAPLNVSPPQGDVAYNLTLGNVARTTYTVTATRAGDQVNDICGNLTITHTGVKGVSVGTVADCW